MGKLVLNILCRNCGVMFAASVDTPNLMQNCPRCYNKDMEKTKCFYCDEEAKYTQPGQNTGRIIDVCEKHFTFKYWG